MDQGGMSEKTGRENTVGAEEEIYCICRSSDVSRFM